MPERYCARYPLVAVRPPESRNLCRTIVTATHSYRVLTFRRASVYPVPADMPRSAETRRGRSEPLGVPYPSKVTLPARRSTIIRRQRLIDSLSQAVERRIALVSAPAGYGKTTLLMDFAQSWSDPVCW